MKKAEQMVINGDVVGMCHSMDSCSIVEWKRLRSCTATVCKCYCDGNFVGYALKSYSTIVAFIVNDVGYDALRYVYGYTSTSASHISKFFRDYGATETKTYRPI